MLGVLLRQTWLRAEFLEFDRRSLALQTMRSIPDSVDWSTRASDTRHPGALSSSRSTVTGFVAVYVQGVGAEPARVPADNQMGYGNDAFLLAAVRISVESGMKCRFGRLE